MQKKGREGVHAHFVQEVDLEATYRTDQAGQRTNAIDPSLSTQALGFQLRKLVVGGFWLRLKTMLPMR